MAFIIHSHCTAQEYIPLPEDLRHETKITEPLTLRKGYFQGIVSYLYTPYVNTFDDNGDRSKFIPTENGINFSGIAFHGMQFNLGAEYGITDRIQIEFALPYIYSESEYIIKNEKVPYNLVINETEYQKTNGIGDLSAYLSYQFIKKTTLYSALSIGMNFPTGSKGIDTVVTTSGMRELNMPTSSDEYSFTTVLRAKKIIYPYALELKPSFAYSFGNDRYKASASYFDVEGSYGVMLNDWFTISNRWEYFYYPGRAFKQSDFNPIHSYRISTGFIVSQQVKRFRFIEQFNYPIMGKSLTTNSDIFFIVSYKM